MIIVKLIGGLGNQLFQYAVGRHLAEVHNTELKLDISGFETYKLHKYSLSPFNIRENFATPQDLTGLKTCKQSGIERLASVLFKKKEVSELTYAQEKERFIFEPAILDLPDNVYLEGSWQNENYFIGISEIIRKEFTVTTPQVGKDKEIASQIANTESVNLHVRRGDFVSNSLTNELHGVCTIDYYEECISKILNKRKKPHFFIFSDDSAWVEENMDISNEITFVNHNNADKNYEDLYLMSQCKDHIIANSTFSWWAAWLGQAPDKMVCAPKIWLKTDKYNTGSFIPDKWIRV